VTLLADLDAFYLEQPKPWTAVRKAAAGGFAVKKTDVLKLFLIAVLLAVVLALIVAILALR
jgi:hypothetical protein